MVKNLPAMQESWLQLGLGRSPGEGNGNPLQYSYLGNSMDIGALVVKESIETLLFLLINKEVLMCYLTLRF